MVTCEYNIVYSINGNGSTRATTTMGVDNNWCIGNYCNGVTSFPNRFRNTKKKNQIRIMINYDCKV